MTRPLLVPILCGLLAAALQVCHAQAATTTLDQPLGEPAARSLLARFGHGATPSALQRTAMQTPREFFQRAIDERSMQPVAVQVQLDALHGGATETIWARLAPGGSLASTATSAQSRMQLRHEIASLANNQLQALLLQLANGDNQAHEALLVFWLNHFSIFAGKGATALLAGDYARHIEHAMRADSFEALLRASFFHPAMQVYLDNRQSTAPESPAGQRARAQGKTIGINENLARELLELHTLGVGAAYSQQDVQELARIITGAGVYFPSMNTQALQQARAVRHGLFLFDPRRHDSGAKQFLGADFPAGQGLAEIERALHLMASHPATARHLSHKLARRFLADEPPEAVVTAMSEAFLRSGGRISSTLHALFLSGEFQASLAAPDKFREPLDFVLAASRAACGDQPITNGPLLLSTLRAMGQLPLRHVTPDGYGTQEQDWLSPVSMTRRLRLAQDISQQRLAFVLPDSRAAGQPARAPQPCKASVPQIRALLGPLGAQTEAALQGLSPREQTALLLASPEFMRR